MGGVGCGWRKGGREREKGREERSTAEYFKQSSLVSKFDAI